MFDGPANVMVNDKFQRTRFLFHVYRQEGLSRLLYTLAITFCFRSTRGPELNQQGVCPRIYSFAVAGLSVRRRSARFAYVLLYTCYGYVPRGLTSPRCVS